jgi:hypothetical protein
MVSSDRKAARTTYGAEDQMSRGEVSLKARTEVERRIADKVRNLAESMVSGLEVVYGRDRWVELWMGITRSSILIL